MSDLIWGAVDIVNRVTNNVRDIVQRHRKKVIALVVIGGTTYLAVRYVRGKLNEIKQIQSDQEKQLLRMRMQTYFDNAQRTCDGSIGSSFIVTLKVSDRSSTLTLQDNLSRILEIPSTNDLRNSMKDNTAKQLLWDKVKINSFSRTICSIYATCLLILFVRIEVNILGKYLYMDVDTAGTQKNENEKSISEETKKQYLNFTDYILNKGLSDLAEYIHTQVQEELKDVPLTKKMNADDIVNLVTKIRARIEYPVTEAAEDLQEIPRSNNNNEKPMTVRKVQTFHQFLLPPEEGQAFSGQLTCLVDETRDIVESDKFHRILSVSLNEGFQAFSREFKESYAKATSQAPNAPETDPASVLLPLAKITPIIKQVFFTLMDAQPQPVLDQSQQEVLDLTKGNNITWNTSALNNITAPQYNYNSRNLVQAIIDMKDLEDFSYHVFTAVDQ